MAASAVLQANTTKILLAAGAAPNMAPGHVPPLHYWARVGNTEMVTLVLAKGADADAKIGRNETAYDWAGGHEEVRALLKSHMTPAPEREGSGEFEGRRGPD